MLTPKLTLDGSLTFFCSEFGENFHSTSGAKEEAERKFIESCQLREKAQIKSSFKILDICYGLGYNSAAALDAIWSVNPHCQIELIALELEEIVPQKAILYQLLNQWKFPIPDLLKQLADTHSVKSSQLEAQLLLGDARITLPSIQKIGYQADAIFLDPFSPPKCPQLWSVEFLTIVAQCLHPEGKIATYSCAASVRTALKLAGLNIGATQSVGRRSPGTIASFISDDLRVLSQQEQEHLQTRAAIPYRDPDLRDSAEKIHARRQIEQQISPLEPSSQWKKRWERGS